MPCKQCKDGKYKWGNTGECKYDSKESCEKANPKKYNKMRPTPLGKKTYEEYEKELKEYNLTKVEFSAFGDLKKISNSLEDTVAAGEQLTNLSNKLYKEGNGLIAQRKELDKKFEALKKETTPVFKDTRETLQKGRNLADQGEKLANTISAQLKELGIKNSTADAEISRFESLSKKARSLEQDIDALPF
jgi:uncharacterized protein (DUF3084 family)